MPSEFLDFDEFALGGGSTARALAVREGVMPTPSMTLTEIMDGNAGEIAAAGFRQENFIPVIYNLTQRMSFMEDPDYFFVEDPEVVQEKDHVPFWVYEGSRSQDESRFLRQLYLQEVEDRQTLANTGAFGIVAAVAGGVLSPENLIPVGAAFGLGKAGVSAARLGFIGRTAATGLAAGAISELGLQAGQLTRTPEESFANIAFAGIFGAGVGGVAYPIAKVRAEMAKIDLEMAAQARHMGEEAQKVFQGKLDEAVRLRGAPGRLEGESSSAFMDDVMKAADESLREAYGRAKPEVKLPQGAFGKVARFMFKFNPSNRVAFSPIKSSNQAMRNWVEYFLVTPEARAIQPVEATLALRIGEGHLALREMETLLGGLRREGGPRIKTDEWWDLVTRTARNDAVVPDASIDPAIKASAESAAQRYLAWADQVGEDSIRLGLIRDTDLGGTARSYVMRMYNQDAVARDIITMPNGEQRSLRQTLFQWLEEGGSTDLEGDLRRVLSHITDGGTGFLNGTSSAYIRGLSGRFKDREILLPDAILEPWLINDLRDIVPAFMAGALPQIEMARRFAANSPAFHTIRADMDKVIEAVGRGDFRKAHEFLEDTQHLQTAGVFDATRDAADFQKARSVDELVERLRSTRTRLEDIKDQKAQSIVEERKVLKSDLEDIREQLQSFRDEARELQDNLYDGKPPEQLSTQVETRTKAPTTGEQRAALIDKIRDVTYKTQSLEARRNVDGVGILSATDGMVAREADRMIQASENPKEIARINKQKSDDLRDLRAMHDRVMERNSMIYRDPVRFAGVVRGLRNLRHFNVMTKMNNIVFTSSPDAGSTIAAIGMENYAKAFREIMSSPLARVADRTDLPMVVRLVDAVEHTMMGNRAAVNFDLMQAGVQGGLFSKAMSRMSHRFMQFTGFHKYNGSAKAIAALGSITKNIDNARRLVDGTATPKIIEDLRANGIDRSMAERIVAQWESTRAATGDAGAFDKVRLAAIDLWDDVGAKNAINTAAIMDSRRGVVTVGAGDTPLFFDEEIAKVFTQFRNFMVGAHQRVGIVGAQRGWYLGDADVAFGGMTSVAMGMLAFAMIEIMKGRDPFEKDARKWIVEGLDRSGWLPALFEASNSLEKTFGYGLSQAIAGEPASRYASRGVVDGMLGPSVGVVEDSGAVMRDVFTGTVSQSTFKRGQRLGPFINLPYLRWLTDGMRESFTEDLPANRAEARR